MRKETRQTVSSVIAADFVNEKIHPDQPKDSTMGCTHAKNAAPPQAKSATLPQDAKIALPLPQAKSFVVPPLVVVPSVLDLLAVSPEEFSKTPPPPVSELTASLDASSSASTSSSAMNPADTIVHVDVDDELQLLLPLPPSASSSTSATSRLLEEEDADEDRSALSLYYAPGFGEVILPYTASLLIAKKDKDKSEGVLREGVFVSTTVSSSSSSSSTSATRSANAAPPPPSSSSRIGGAYHLGVLLTSYTSSTSDRFRQLLDVGYSGVSNVIARKASSSSSSSSSAHRAGGASEALASVASSALHLVDQQQEQEAEQQRHGCGGKNDKGGGVGRGGVGVGRGVVGGCMGGRVCTGVGGVASSFFTCDSDDILVYSSSSLGHPSSSDFPSFSYSVSSKEEAPSS